MKRLSLFVLLVLLPLPAYAFGLSSLIGGVVPEMGSVAEIGAMAYIAYLIFNHPQLAMLFAFLFVSYKALQQAGKVKTSGDKVVQELAKDGLTKTELVLALLGGAKGTIILVGFMSVGLGTAWAAYEVFMAMLSFSSAQ